LRLDHYLTAKDTFNFRYSFSQGSVTDPLSTSGANVPGFPVGEDQRSQSFVAQETTLFRRPSWGWRDFLSSAINSSLTTASITPIRNTRLHLQAFAQRRTRPAIYSSRGFASVGDPITGPRNTYENTFDLNGSLTWIRGRHEMKFGAATAMTRSTYCQGIAK